MSHGHAIRRGSGPTDKNSIRKAVLKKRDSMPFSIRKKKSLTIKERLFELKEFKDAGSIFLYASIRSEVQTEDMIRESLSMGKKVILPKVDKKTLSLRLYEITSLDELTQGYMGIPEPKPLNERQRDINDADAVIMPVAAFDLKGGRLGYGKGYYDKTLSGINRKIALIGIAFEEQMVGSLPLELHDIRLNIIITDKGTLWTKRK